MRSGCGSTERPVASGRASWWLRRWRPSGRPRISGRRRWRWTGGRLRVARALGIGWDDHYSAYHLETALSRGRHHLQGRHVGRVQDQRLLQLGHGVLDPVLPDEHLGEAEVEGRQLHADVEVVDVLILLDHWGQPLEQRQRLLVLL